MLFSELATLVSQNQSRPEFLPQLFQELKSLRGNADCQRVLNSVREIGGRRVSGEA
jgi:Pericentriolar material 1 C terminus